MYVGHWAEKAIFPFFLSKRVLGCLIRLVITHNFCSCNNSTVALTRVGNNLSLGQGSLAVSRVRVTIAVQIVLIFCI